MKDESVLIVEHPAGGVARLVLNRPQQRNALSEALRSSLADRLTELAADDSVQTVILSAAGEAFCAGFDLKELSAGNSQEIFAAAEHYHRVVHRFAKPLIVAIDGPALAGGMDLTLMCDVRIGSERAAFGQPQVRFGVPAAYDLLASVMGETSARYLCLTGALIDAKDALAQGVLSACVKGSAALERAALDCATAIVASGIGAKTKGNILARQPALFGHREGMQ